MSQVALDLPQTGATDVQAITTHALLILMVHGEIAHARIHRRRKSLASRVAASRIRIRSGARAAFSLSRPLCDLFVAFRATSQRVSLRAVRVSRLSLIKSLCPIRRRHSDSRRSLSPQHAPCRCGAARPQSQRTMRMSYFAMERLAQHLLPGLPRQHTHLNRGSGL